MGDVLVDARDGSPAALPTRISLWRDDARLYVLFAAEDDEIVATKRRHDDDLWTEDVFEVFLAPERPESYFELEVNPLGTIFDARVSSPERRRQSMAVDRSWTCSGLWPAIRINRVGATLNALDALLAIPFRALGVESPDAGTEWRANFYRIDRSTRGDSFAAWAPTMADPPDFHRPDHFGSLVFT